MSDLPIKVLVVDDHELVRTGLRAVLDGDSAIRVVAEASDGVQALAAVALHQPDLVVMDLQMAGMGGIEATRRISAAHPDITILVLTMYDDDESVFAAIQAGAQGYVLKGAPRNELRAAVVAAAQGQTVFGPGIAARVLSSLGRSPSLAPNDPLVTLTPREHQILEAMVGGLQPPAIGRRLAVSEKTVRNNISAILTKLQTSSRDEAIARARCAGVGSPGQRGASNPRGVGG